MTNADLEQMVETSDEWIVSRTGIQERRIADNGLAGSDMAAAACRQALDMANCCGDEINLLIVGTVTPDYRQPSQACIVQEKLGLPNVVAFDVVAACTGFINSLSIAASFIGSHRNNKVMICGVKKLSAITNYQDRSTCVFFGDGAGAAVVGPATNGSGVISSFRRSDGIRSKWLWMEAGGTLHPITPDYKFNGRDKIMMNGSDVFKVAVREMVAAAKKVVADAGLTPRDIALVVPHQANIRIIEALLKRLGIGKNRVFLNIDKYGNTSAASVPLALDDANRQGRTHPGDYILRVDTAAA